MLKSRSLIIDWVFDTLVILWESFSIFETSWYFWVLELQFNILLNEITRNHYDNGYSQYQAQVSGKTTDKTEQVYSILLQTFKAENFAIIVGAWKLLTIVAKSSILNVLGIALCAPLKVCRKNVIAKRRLTN